MTETEQNTPDEAAPIGRPTKYRDEYVEQAFKLCLLGATDKEMAAFFSVCEATFHNWKNEHPEFLESITQGKLRADAEVAEKLYHRALGYTHPEEKIFSNGGEIVRASTTKHYPPDTQAASLWLRNRQPDKWREKVVNEHTGPNGGPLQTQDVTLTPEEAKAISQALDDEC
ncbi:MAG: helix-turn-helix domain-containing protein [Acetobacteraceae bacterium]